MELKTQIISFLISFLYGFIIYKTFLKYNIYFYNYKKIYNFFNSFLYTIILILVYFKIHYFINKGNINVYFILVTLITSVYLIYKRSTTSNILKK